MQKKIARLFYFGILFVWLLIACNPANVTTPPKSNTFKEMILPPECSAPCWAGIQVGVTSFDDAKQILLERYKNISDDGRSLVWSNKEVDNLLQGYITFVDGIAYDIILIFDIEADFQVGSFVEILGQPTWVQVTLDPIDPCRGIRFLYPDKGLYADLDMMNEQKGEVVASRKIFLLRFLQSESLKGGDSVPDGVLKKWTGYKDYCSE